MLHERVEDAAWNAGCATSRGCAHGTIADGTDFGCGCVDAVLGAILGGGGAGAGGCGCISKNPRVDAELRDVESRVGARGDVGS
ncbi:MAG: hypothetical protein ABIO72_02395 [Patescibacteria group bacterium]